MDSGLARRKPGSPWPRPVSLAPFCGCRLEAELGGDVAVPLAGGRGAVGSSEPPGKFSLFFGAAPERLDKPPG